MFSKLNFHVPEETVRRIVLSTAGVIEPVLSALREKIDKKLEHATENILVCTVCLCMCVLGDMNATTQIITVARSLPLQLEKQPHFEHIFSFELRIWSTMTPETRRNLVQVDLFCYCMYTNT